MAITFIGAWLVCLEVSAEEPRAGLLDGYRWGVGLGVGGVLSDQGDALYGGGAFRFTHTLAPFRLDVHVQASGRPGVHLGSLGVGAAWLPLENGISPFVGLGASFLIGYWPHHHGGEDGLGLYGTLGAEFFRGSKVNLLAELRITMVMFELKGFTPFVPQGWLIMLW